MQGNEAKGPQSIDGLIRSFLRDNGLNLRARHTKVFDTWSEVIGAELREHAVPVRFRGDVLTVEVDSSAHLQELRNFTGEAFRTQTNRRLGGNAIRKVVFKLRG